MERYLQTVTTFLEIWPIPKIIVLPGLLQTDDTTGRQTDRRRNKAQDGHWRERERQRENMARNPPRPPIPETDANELLRRHFEARFQPIEADGAGAAALCKENVGSSGQSPEWSGLSASSDNDDDDDDDDDNEGRCDAESGDDCDSDDDDDVEMQDEGMLTNTGHNKAQTRLTKCGRLLDDITAIEVVDHSAQQTPKQNTTTMSKRELKAFMVSPASLSRPVFPCRWPCSLQHHQAG